MMNDKLTADSLPELPEPIIHRDIIGDAIGGYLDPDAQFTADQMRAFAALAVQEERERCAEICATYARKKWDAYKRGAGPDRGNPHTEGESDGADNCAAAIRAQKEPT
jgi:hypothetical protein